MPRKAQELGALAVSRLTGVGFHAVGGVAGLNLQISENGARSWVLRAMIAGKRRNMGLGGYPDVTLAQARENARDARDKIAQGLDPIGERRAAQAALRAAVKPKSIKFKLAAATYIAAQEAKWRSNVTTTIWTGAIANYANPVIGEKYVNEISDEDVLAILEPIWRTKTVTAVGVRGRVEEILDWCRVKGYRTGDNPARWTGHLEMMLPSPNKVHVVKHHEALPVEEMPAFMAELRKQTLWGVEALEFLILTVGRTIEVREARWPQFDLERATWVIAADDMKGWRTHRIALSTRAVEIVKQRPVIVGNPYLFPGNRGGHIGEGALSQIMKDMGLTAKVHGFRSTFKDWASEKTNFPNEVSEMALAHKIKDKTEAAYRRGDLLEKRRPLMQAWADFCNGE